VHLNPVESNAEFERLVDAYYEALYRFALSLTQSEADAADLTQDTFYTFAAKGSQIRERSKVKSWLFTTLHRKFLGLKRHSTSFPKVELEAAQAHLPAVVTDTIRSMDAASVLGMLQRVDEPYRIPLVLHYFEDHSYREIAEILEIPLGTVMSRISRGKAELRKHLSPPAEGKVIPLEQRQIFP
jgi:RNA polymerase sigma factor (sigma-70 family)